MITPTAPTPREAMAAPATSGAPLRFAARVAPGPSPRKRARTSAISSAGLMRKMDSVGQDCTQAGAS